MIGPLLIIFDFILGRKMKYLSLLFFVLSIEASYAEVLEGMLFHYDGEKVSLEGSDGEKYLITERENRIEFKDRYNKLHSIPFYPHKLCKRQDGTFEFWTYYDNNDDTYGLLGEDVDTDSISNQSIIRDSSLCGLVTVTNKVRILRSYLQGGFTEDRRLNIAGYPDSSTIAGLLIEDVLPGSPWPLTGRTPPAVYGDIVGSVTIQRTPMTGKVYLYSVEQEEDPESHVIRIQDSTISGGVSSPFRLVSNSKNITLLYATINGYPDISDSLSKSKTANGEINILNSTIEGNPTISGKFTMFNYSTISAGGTYTSLNGGIEIYGGTNITANLDVKDFIPLKNKRADVASRVALEAIQATGTATVEGNVYLQLVNLYGGTFKGDSGHGLRISQSDVRSNATFEGHIVAYYADFESGTYNGHAVGNTVYSEIYLDPNAVPRQKMKGNVFKGSYFILQPTDTLKINENSSTVANYPRAIGLGENTILGTNVKFNGYVQVWRSTLGANATLTGVIGNGFNADAGIFVDNSTTIASGVSVSGVVYLGTSHINNSISLYGKFVQSNRFSRLHFSTVPSGISLSGAMYSYGINFQQSWSGLYRCDLNQSGVGYTCTPTDNAFSGEGVEEIKAPWQLTDPYYDRLRLAMLDEKHKGTEH